MPHWPYKACISYSFHFATAPPPEDYKNFTKGGLPEARDFLKTGQLPNE
jgi:hypothetical protein